MNLTSSGLSDGMERWGGDGKFIIVSIVEAIELKSPTLALLRDDIRRCPMINESCLKK